MPYFLACVLLWSCSSTPPEPEQEELVLYNHLIDQLAWQCDQACKGSGASNQIAWSNNGRDSIRDAMRAQTDRHVLYYQPKISATYKIPALSEWFTVELSSWDRFFSTFPTTLVDKVVPILTASTSLEVADLRIDYMDIAKLDTAARAPQDSVSAVIRFSQPYYNDDRNRAVVYFESACSSEKARGELLMVRYKEKRWLIEERRMVWIRHAVTQ